VLKKHLPNMSDIQKHELREGILQIWDSFLPIGEENDLAFEIGTLLVELGFLVDALEFLQRSVDLYGPAAGTVYNMAVCYYSLGQMEEAQAYVGQALQMDHEFKEAKALSAELTSELESVSVKRRRRRA
jgi:tetratricopeptide (TPR) repeat protein